MLILSAPASKVDLEHLWTFPFISGYYRPYYKKRRIFSLQFIWQYLSSPLGRYHRGRSNWMAWSSEGTSPFIWCRRAENTTRETFTEFWRSPITMGNVIYC